MWALRWSGFVLLVFVACEAPFISQGDTESAAGAGGSAEGSSAGVGPVESGAGAGGEAESGRAGQPGHAGSRNQSGGAPNGGATNVGGGTGGTSPIQATACADLAGVGVFEDITPPEVKAGLGEQTTTGDEQGGPFSLEIDPVQRGTYYVGTMHQGLWKTTDCGSSWVVIASGKNADRINRGINWTLGIDHRMPSTLYTSAAYSVNGLFKSKDGGVSWVDVWSIDTQPELAQAFEYNFVNQVVVDPEDSQHLLLTMHENCRPPHTTTCILESKDAGSTWELHEGDASWKADQGPVVHFLGSPTTWLTGSQTNGVWRTSDSGKTWGHVTEMTTTAQQGVALVRARNGVFFLGGSDGIWRSEDGALDSWALAADTGPFVSGLATNGTTVYASTCYAADYCEQPRYLTSNDGKKWQAMTGVPALSQGGLLRYDAEHRLLVSSNGGAGVWRVVVP